MRSHKEQQTENTVSSGKIWGRAAQAPEGRRSCQLASHPWSLMAVNTVIAGFLEGIILVGPPVSANLTFLFPPRSRSFPLLLEEGNRGFAAFLTPRKRGCGCSIHSPPTPMALGALLLWGRCAVYVQCKFPSAFVFKIKKHWRGKTKLLKLHKRLWVHSFLFLGVINMVPEKAPSRSWETKQLFKGVAPKLVNFENTKWSWRFFIPLISCNFQLWCCLTGFISTPVEHCSSGFFAVRYK